VIASGLDTIDRVYLREIGYTKCTMEPWTLFVCLESEVVLAVYYLCTGDGCPHLTQKHHASWRQSNFLPTPSWQRCWRPRVMQRLQGRASPIMRTLADTRNVITRPAKIRWIFTTSYTGAFASRTCSPCPLPARLQWVFRIRNVFSAL
jgi:hypothetical protein